MKPSSEALKSLRGRRRWQAALNRRLQAAPLSLHDYIATLRPTAQTLAEAVCAIDLSGRIYYANPAFQRMLARTEPELVGASIFEFGWCAATDARDATALTLSTLRDAVAQSGSHEFGACEWKLPDGSLVVSCCSLRPVVHAGRTLGMMLVATQTGTREAGDGLFAGGDRRETRSALQVNAIHEGAQAERRLRVMEKVGSIALAHLSLDGLLRALLDGIRREMALENVAILLVDEDGDMVTARAVSGAGEEIASHVRVPFGEGIVGEAMRTRRPVVIPNVRRVADQLTHFTAEIRASMNLQSLVMVPLIVDDRPIGVIYVGASQPDHFSPEDVRLVDLVGERAALAIERARANDEAARAHERLRFLNDASGALNATLDYHDTTQRLAAILTPALGDACAIYLLEDDGLLRKVVVRAPAQGLLSPDRIDVALRQFVDGLAATVEVHTDDTTSAIGRSVSTLVPVFERQALAVGEAGAMGSCICAPLVVRQHALGALYLASRPGKDYSAGDVALVQGLAERAAIAIDNARLYTETQQALASGSATATQLDTIFDATDVGIFVTDTNGDFLRINPYGAHLLGLAYASLDRNIPTNAQRFELRTPEGEVIPPEREPLRLARVTGQPVEQRVIIHRQDGGKDVQALARCTPWFDERRQIAGAIGVITDITAISELERQKDEFLGIASHELKTPLTSLKILAQLLARKMEASGEIRDLEQANRMQVAITRMERLINDLLDVTRIQEGKLALNREVTNLGELCADAASEQELLSQRVVRFSAPKDAELFVYADPERIHQVLTNLLSNAIKYSPAREPVVVRARVTADECIVSVHDHGPGVPPEALEHIFERFFRVPGMQVQSGSGVGLGLGLNISSEIISRHGGRIWVESKLGHGSVFSFALPRAAAAPGS